MGTDDVFEKVNKKRKMIGKFIEGLLDKRTSL